MADAHKGDIHFFTFSVFLLSSCSSGPDSVHGFGPATFGASASALVSQYKNHGPSYTSSTGAFTQDIEYSDALIGPNMLIVARSDKIVAVMAPIKMACNEAYSSMEAKYGAPALGDGILFRG